MHRTVILKRTATEWRPCVQRIRCMSQRQPPVDLEQDEYKPWSNENATCGTTRETVDRNVASDRCVDAQKELVEDRWESEARGEDGVLEYSAANPRMSEMPDGEEGMWKRSDADHNPSFYEQQPKRPPPKEGLFKPAKKPLYRNLT